MEQFISEYLLSNACCPLPGIGELQFHAKSATFSQTEQTMIPPVLDVILVRRNVEEEPLVEFISSRRSVSPERCRAELRAWCNEVLNMESGEKYLTGVGTFFVDAAGRMQFRSQQLHSALLPEVKATRVIRKEQNHQILVGDRESSAVQMTEYFQDSGKVSKQRWWIAAALMGGAAAIAITAYLLTNPQPGFFGNRQSVQTPATPETYTQPN